MPELLNRHTLRERHFKGIETHKSCDPQVCSRAAIGALLDELDRLHNVSSWEYFAALAFAYFDAPEGTDDVEVAWYEMAEAIRHWRLLGGREPSLGFEILPEPEVADGS